MTTAASNRARSTCCCSCGGVVSSTRRARGNRAGSAYAGRWSATVTRQPSVAPISTTGSASGPPPISSSSRGMPVEQRNKRTRKAAALDDPCGGRDRIGTSVRGQEVSQRLREVRAAGPDRRPPRASSRWAEPAPRNRARRHTGHAPAARSTLPTSRTAPSSLPGSSRTSQTSMPPSQPAPRPHSRSSSPPLSYRTIFGRARLEHRRRMRRKVALEAATGEDSLVATASADEHLCARPCGRSNPGWRRRSQARAAPAPHAPVRTAEPIDAMIHP